MVASEEGLVLAERFACTRLLKSGGGVSTYAGTDRQTGHEVVVKTVEEASVPPAVRLRVAHEAVILRRLAGPDVHPLVAVGSDGGLLYLVQPFVPGLTLKDRLAASGALSVASALRVGTRALAALQYAHEGGVLHRDVKPANVIVDDGEPIERAVLVDFGFARGAWLDPAVREDPLETARYLAPEAAGALGGQGVDERADLYSLGVVLFECLAGTSPFDGRDVGEVLRQHLSATTPSLLSLRDGVPRALDEVVQRLLRKVPGERYQSASAALVDLRAIEAAVERGETDPPVVVGLHDCRQALTEPAFVGRAAELVLLTGLVDDAAAGRGRLVLLGAESGGGKTRLLEELAQTAGPSTWALRGTGVDQAAHRPFQVLDGVATAIAAEAERRPELAASLRRRLGTRAAAAAAALPALGPALAGTDEDGDTGPAAYGEARSVEALVALLESLGEPGRPALILLDDCQWADRLSLRLLARLGTRAESGDVHALVVAAFRPEGAGARLAHEVEHAVRLDLPPLAPEEMAGLLESMAGPVPSPAAEVVARLAEGSPFMATAVLRGLVESGALVNSDAGWRVDSTRLESAQTSRRAALFLVRRLELLSEDALGLLSVGAVLGKQFDLALAVELFGRPALTAAAAVSESVGRRILWVDEATSRCTFRHDMLREALLARLTEGDRRSLHLRAALRMEVTGDDRPFELAYHFDAGGRSERALPFALRAADEARRRHSLEVAAAQYRIAERATATDAGTRAQVAEGLGDVLTLMGEYEEASACLVQALALVKGADRQAEIEGKLGDVAFKRGDQRQARQHLERALRLLGRRVPRRAPVFLVLLIEELVVQALHTLLPRLFTGRRRVEKAGRDLMAVRIYSRLTYVYWFSAGKVPCAWSHLREMNLAERYPPTAELAQAYSEHAPVMTMVPWYRRGIAYARRSLAVRQARGDLWGQGQSLSFYGAVLYSASRYRECIARCEEAVHLLERTGDRWEMNTATWHTAFAYYRLGELDRAARICRDLYASASQIGDRTSAGIALSGWARATGGQVPEALVRGHLRLGFDDAHTGTEVRLAEGVRLLAAGDVDGAIATFDEAVSIVNQAGLRQEYVAPALPWLATALRLRAEQAPPFRSLRQRAQVRRAAEVARRAAAVSRDYRNNRPHALRERALVAALRGRGWRARRLFRAALAEAALQGARYEHALTRQAFGRAGAGFGWAGAAEMLLQAETDLRVMMPADPDEGTGTEEPATASLSLADRFETLLGAGRAIASATSVEAIHTAVLEAASNLLRGDRCELVVLGANGEPVAEDGRLAADPAGRELVARALAAGAPVVSSEDGLGGVSDVLMLLGLRSVLCAPVWCDERPVACLVAGHHQIGNLFSHDEVRLAEYLTTLAGAALEHVAGTEARFNSLAQNSSDVITIVDHHGTVTYQGSSVRRVFGFEAADRVGRPLVDWAHPDDAGTVAAVLQAAAAGEPVPALVEWRLAHGDGSWRHVETAIADLSGVPGLRGLVLNSRDVSERRALEEALRSRALHDDLTGLANRGLFADRINHCLAHRSGRPVTVLFLDLDDFKGVNDSLGHPAGDVLLKGVARRLLTCVRPQDTVARLGGDEFAVLLEDTDERQGRRVAERVLAAMAPAFELDGQPVHARTSVGVASGNTGGVVDASELLSRADAAMYVAKARGKGRYEVFVSEMQERARERVMIQTDLQWAVQADEMEVHYQPLVGLRTGEVVGFEAVLRWRHPTRGLLGPADFIEVAEDSGLIVPIGAWTIRQACREGRRLQRAHPERAPFGISVNVSSRQLQDRGLLEEVEVALAESGFDPRLLTLEITESATFDDAEGAIAKLRDLKALGTRLAIDDFGTGYSSLAYLRRFPVDQLKIDRSFVAGLGKDSQDTAIVTSVIGLAHALGLEAVAEGVETLAQLEHLTSLGCDIAQGFNWRRPAALADVDAWLTPAATFLGDHGLLDGPGRNGPVRVVLVDDRPELRAAIRIAMELDGQFKVVAEASDGQEAIATVARYRPELVVLDVVMPGMGGLQALPAIRLAAPGAAVVLLTASDRSDLPDHEVGQALGFLDKTLDLDSLVARLSGLLGSAA